MEFTRLLIQLIQAVAWPSVAIFIIYMFKEKITAMLDRLHDAEIPGGIKLNFEKEIRQAEDLSRQVKEIAKQKYPDIIKNVSIIDINARMVSLGLRPSPSGFDVAYYRRLAARDPNIALAGLRMEFEIMARNLAKGFNIDVEDRDSAGDLFRKLYDHNAITIQQYQLAKSVLNLCDAAIHGANVNRQEADSVLDVAKVLSDDYVSWLSWGFPDGWSPPAEVSQAGA